MSRNKSCSAVAIDEVRTSSSNTEILPEDTPISILHLVERFVAPMSLVRSRLVCRTTFESIGVSARSEENTVSLSSSKKLEGKEREN